MKKTILIISVIIIGLNIAIKSGTLNALIMFFLLGIIPGTDIAIPANIMLLMISATACAVLFYSTGRHILHVILDRYTVEREEKTSSNLSKHRFKKIEA